MKEFNKKFNRIFVTGDIHGDVRDLWERICRIPDASKDDLLIILGDCGFFYYHFFGNVKKDFLMQQAAAELPITILCIQGNHEVPFKDMPAERIKLFGGAGFESNEIYFADNGTTLTINNKTFLVIGGAYSVNKEIRILRKYGWWEHEELTDAELAEIENQVKGKKYDYVITHTCPYNNLPREVFLAEVDQSKVENRTEKVLQKIHDSISFDHWYCGHFHTDKIDGKIEFFYRSLKQIM
jgi:3-oxoacid CoA-transferase subunit A